ncbi:hypothetical protein C9173_22540, partial [Escherichia coli]
MNIRNQYNEALNKLEVDVNDGLRDLINIYCVAIDSFENDIVDSIAGFAPIFPDICYHLTHYKPAAADIPV